MDVVRNTPASPNPAATPPPAQPDYPLGTPPPTSAPQYPEHKSRRHEGLRSIASTLSVLIIAPLVALLLTAFIFQSYQVDGQSMEPTLQNNDRLVVWKLPRTWAKITGNPYIPARGDIVIFTENALAAYGQEQGKQLIKRVIGLPGERVVVKDGKVTVYNDERPEGFQPDLSLPYGKTLQTTEGEIDIKVPEGQVFVCGDNRDNSLDSRTFGPISANDIVGKLMVRVLPINKAGSF